MAPTSRGLLLGAALVLIMLWLATISAPSPILAADSPKDAPEIFALSPSEGPAGAKITIRGSGFSGTKYVIFAVGRTGRLAKFKVLSASELEVTAPPYLHSGESATVAVVTSKGATIGVPASALEVDGTHSTGGTAATFYHVLRGGLVNSPQGVALVEDGGTAVAPRTAALCLVKRGGTLQDVEHFSGLVIREPKAMIKSAKQPQQKSRKPEHILRLLTVPEITASLGVEPFIYYRPDSADSVADSPPIVRSLGPARVPSGGILTLHGKGFSETEQVLVVSRHGSANERSAGFRIVSDKELEVEIPDTLTGTADLVIVNPKGATLVAAQREAARPGAKFASWTRPSRAAPSHRATRALAVADKGRLETTSDGPVSFIKEGDTVDNARSGAVLLVRKGGRVNLSANGMTVFHEPGADVTGGQQRNANVREVESVHLDLLPTTFEAFRP